MDFKEFRNSAIERFLIGNAEPLARQILENDLNKLEREFIAQLVQGNIPKGPRGPKPNSLKPMAAALIRFWRAEMDGWKEVDAIRRDIEVRLEVSGTMARKLLKQIDLPATKFQKVLRIYTDLKIAERQRAIDWKDDELIGLYRDSDLKPISVE